MRRPASLPFQIALVLAITGGGILFPRNARGSQPLPTMRQPGFAVSVFASNLSAVNAITLDKDGSLLVSEYNVGDIKRIALDGSQSVVASGIPFPTGIAIRPDGALFVTSATSSTSNLLAVSSAGQTSVFACCFSFPTALAADTLGNLYVANSGSGSISRVAPDGAVTQVVAGFSQSGGPSGLAFDSSGTLYFTEHATGSVYDKPVGGSPQLLISGLAPFGPTYLALDAAGNLYVSDSGDGTLTLRKRDGTVETFATGFLGKGTAPVIGPTGIVFADGDTMLVANGDEILRIVGPFTETLPKAVLSVRGVNECDSFAGAHVPMDASQSTDPDGEPLVYSFSTPLEQVNDQTSPIFIATLPLGGSQVTLTVKDASGNTSSVSTLVVVVDTRPPVISATLTPGPSPNSNVLVSSFSATDVCDPQPSVSGVIGSGVANGESVMLQENATVGVLRLESPSFGLVVTAKDRSGNVSTKTVAVSP